MNFCWEWKIEKFLLTPIIVLIIYCTVTNLILGLFCVPPPYSPLSHCPRLIHRFMMITYDGKKTESRIHVSLCVRRYDLPNTRYPLLGLNKLKDILIFVKITLKQFHYSTLWQNITKWTKHNFFYHIKFSTAITGIFLIIINFP